MLLYLSKDKIEVSAIVECTSLGLLVLDSLTLFSTLNIAVTVFFCYETDLCSKTTMLVSINSVILYEFSVMPELAQATMHIPIFPVATD